jgi:hypothetical protein
MQIFIGLSVSIINHIVNSIIPLPKLTNFH